MVVASSIAIILCCGSIANNEYLHKLKQSIISPKRFSSISVYLIESLLQQYTSAFQFYMYQWQTIHKDGDIISVLLRSAIYSILVYHLSDIVVHILLVYQGNIHLSSILTDKTLLVVTLNSESLFLDTIRLLCYFSLKEPLPLTISKCDIIQLLQLLAKIRYQLRLFMDGKILISLSLKLGNQFILQVTLTLVTCFPFTFLTHILSNNCTLSIL